MVVSTPNIDLADAEDCSVVTVIQDGRIVVEFQCPKRWVRLNYETGLWEHSDDKSNWEPIP